MLMLLEAWLVSSTHGFMFSTFMKSPLVSFLVRRRGVVEDHLESYFLNNYNQFPPLIQTAGQSEICVFVEKLSLALFFNMVSYAPSIFRFSQIVRYISCCLHRATMGILGTAMAFAMLLR